MPEELLQHEAECEITLNGGETVTLQFRPFTLRDVAWMQREFPNREALDELQQLKADAVCRVIWNILTPDSKMIFSNIKFVKDYDDDKDEVVEIKVKGHEKLLHSISKQEDLLRLFTEYAKMQSLNNFVSIPSKKK